MGVYVYIDGFNLYYGALKGTPHRWLNVDTLLNHLIPTRYHPIAKIKYFTARVSGATDLDAPRRQRIYLNALETIPTVEIFYGSFLAKTIWRPLINLPVGNEIIHSPTQVVLPPGNHVVGAVRPQTLPVSNYPAPGARRPKTPPTPLPNALIAQVHAMEEKGSDVNLAAHLINDAWMNLFDAAAVVSNDTDLVTPIMMVTKQRRKPVFLICPGRWGASPKLKAVSTWVRHIHPAVLAASQFPNPVVRPYGPPLAKPATW
ncbi:MAG: NYN domain-containing protein [Alphaproteobacteria bacterium]